MRQLLLGSAFSWNEIFVLYVRPQRPDTTKQIMLTMDYSASLSSFRIAIPAGTLFVSCSVANIAISFAHGIPSWAPVFPMSNAEAMQAR